MKKPALYTLEFIIGLALAILISYGMGVRMDVIEFVYQGF